MVRSGVWLTALAAAIGAVCVAVGGWALAGLRRRGVRVRDDCAGRAAARDGTATCTAVYRDADGREFRRRVPAGAPPPAEATDDAVAKAVGIPLLAFGALLLLYGLFELRNAWNRSAPIPPTSAGNAYRFRSTAAVDRVTVVPIDDGFPSPVEARPGIPVRRDPVWDRHAAVDGTPVVMRP